MCITLYNTAIEKLFFSRSPNDEKTLFEYRSGNTINAVGGLSGSYTKTIDKEEQSYMLYLDPRYELLHTTDLVWCTPTTITYYDCNNGTATGYTSSYYERVYVGLGNAPIELVSESVSVPDRAVTSGTYWFDSPWCASLGPNGYYDITEFAAFSNTYPYGDINMYNYPSTGGFTVAPSDGAVHIMQSTPTDVTRRWWGATIGLPGDPDPSWNQSTTKTFQNKIYECAYSGRGINIISTIDLSTVEYLPGDVPRYMPSGLISIKRLK